MKHSPHYYFLGAFLLVFHGMPSTIAAQDVLPGGKHPSGRQLQNEYYTMVHRGVELFHRDWEKACNTGDVHAITELYLKQANVLTSAGSFIRGRDSINLWYKQGLARMSGCRMTYEDIVASGDLASINGRIRYDLALPTGGSVAHSVSFQMTLRLQYIDEWRVESQTGGDLPPIVTIVATPPAQLVPGTSDSINVLLTDGLGHPLQNVLVAFALEVGEATISPVTSVTDHTGRAIAVITAGAQPGPTKVRVTTSLNKEAMFVTTSVVSADNRTPSPIPSGQSK